MNIGQHDRYITLQRNREYRDAYNAPVRRWASITHFWARRTDGRGAERDAPGAIKGKNEVTWRVRFYEDIRSQDRIIGDDGEIYDIQYTRLVGRRHLIDIVTTHSTELN